MTRRDLDLLTSILSSLTSDPPRVSAASVSIFLITLHAPLSTVLKRTLDILFLSTLNSPLPTDLIPATNAKESDDRQLIVSWLS